MVVTVSCTVLVVVVTIAITGLISPIHAARQRDASQVSVASSSTEVTRGSGDLCNKWLLIRYESDAAFSRDTPELMGERRVGAFKLTSWDSALLLEKKIEKSGKACLQKFTAKCKKGVMDVQLTCDEETGHHAGRGLSGWLRSRKTSVGKAQELTLHMHEPGLKMNGEGQVTWEVIDPRPALNLMPISERQKGPKKFEAGPGCYCCKRPYIHTDPFNSAGHKAFYNNECMLAWSSGGEDLDSDEVNRSASIRDAAYAEVSRMSLTRTQYSACSLTCPFRADKYAANKYVFSKLAPDRARVNMNTPSETTHYTVKGGGAVSGNGASTAPKMLRFKMPGGDTCLKSGGPHKKLVTDAESGCSLFEIDGMAVKLVADPAQCLDVFGGHNVGLWDCHGRRNQQFHEDGNTWCSGSTCLELFLSPFGESCQRNSECESGMCADAGIWGKGMTCKAKTSVYNSNPMWGGADPEEEIVDCYGEWDGYLDCSVTCGIGVQRKTFVVFTAARNGGKPCEAKDDAIVTRSCTGHFGLACPGATTATAKVPTVANQGKHTLIKDALKVHNPTPDSFSTHYYYKPSVGGMS